MLLNDAKIRKYARKNLAIVTHKDGADGVSRIYVKIEVTMAARLSRYLDAWTNSYQSAGFLKQSHRKSQNVDREGLENQTAGSDRGE